MKVFTAALIDKPLRSINDELSSKITSDLKKYLQVDSNDIISQELNTFILISGKKKGEGKFDVSLIEKIEKGIIRKRLEKYYKNNESRFRKNMQNKQELLETSQIVRDFIKETGSELIKKFNVQLEKISNDLPKTFYQVSMKSFITLWEIEETQEYRFYLSGFDFPIFTGKTSDKPIDVGCLVDKLLIINFFTTFLKPTLLRLEGMHQILDKLELEINKQHYRINDQKLQAKFELFLRILLAKLNALQEIDNLISRIFQLSEIPNTILSQYNIKSDFLDFNSALSNISEDIKFGNVKLNEVSSMIQRCQLCLRDYLDVGELIETIESVEKFKKLLKPLAEISTNLFVEAELLKQWSDFFGTDVPFFSFNIQLLNGLDIQTEDISDDVIISVRGLFKNYNLGRSTVYAVRGVNLDVKKGEFLAILGSSGAGKTTLLNIMAGLDNPDHGFVFFRGKNIHQMKDSKKSKIRLQEMGFIFQSYALLPHFNARENVALPADLAGLSKDLKERIEELLKGVGIDQQAKQFPAQLSGGQMQRVAIARALTNRPIVIFADEPTGDLDSVTGKQVMNLLKKFHEETKTTIIVITHEKDIAAYAERQVIMEDGIIIKH